MGETDRKDKNESRAVAVTLIALVLVLAAGIVLMLPELSGLASAHLEPGLGLKDSAVISFFVTVVLMVVLAIASGDGLLGEIQFILGSFFLFFIIIWLLLAWVF